MGMNGTIVIPVIASILILGLFASVSFDDAFAKKGENNGNNGCDKSNPNSKVCEKNPKTEPPVQTVKVTVINILGDPVPEASCTLVDNGGILLAEGVTDVNGELVVTVPNTVSEIFQTNCIRSESPALFGTQCNVALTDPFTEIIVITSGATGCF